MKGQSHVAPAMAPFLFLRRGGRTGACLEFSPLFSLSFELIILTKEVGLAFMLN